jgi:hypothetical protein
LSVISFTGAISRHFPLSQKYLVALKAVQHTNSGFKFVYIFFDKIVCADFGN